MTTINVPRELLERLSDNCAFLHDTRKAQAELRALLAEQPQAGAGQDAPLCWWINHGSHGQITQREDEAQSAANEGKQVVRYTAAPQPAARQEQGDEVRRLREALKSARDSLSQACGLAADPGIAQSFRKCVDRADAALTHSQQGEEDHAN